MKHVLTVLFCAIFAFLSGCSSGEAKVDQPAPPPSRLRIDSIAAQPPLVRPGQNTTLSISVSNNVGNAVTYAWHATQGTLSTTNSASATWTAPTAEGNYVLSIDVSDGTNAVRGYASVVVSLVTINTVLTGVSPGEAKVGDSVCVIGNGFGATQGANALTIGNQPATSISSWSDTEICAGVPAQAVTGVVKATIGGVDTNEGRIVILWSAGGTNLPVVTEGSPQTNSRLIGDGAGGAIIVWEDYRSGGARLYAQRVNAGGAVQWTTDGVPIAPAAGAQTSTQIASDGAGGAVIVWQDDRNGNGDIYAQRIDGSGAALWTADGVAIAAAADRQISPRIIADGPGGAIIAWEDYRNGNADIYAQRVDSSGAVQWTADGVAVSAAADNQFSPKLVTDGANGAIVAWEDYRSGSQYDIYAQRVDAAGNAQWTADGVAVAAAAGNQLAPQLVSDTASGAIVVWEDYRGAAGDIYGQRLNGAGTPQWTASGIIVCTASASQTSPQLVPDNAGGAVISWVDYRAANADIYAQRLAASGAVQWTANGVAVSTATGNQFLPRMAPDDTGGAIVAWEDYRNDGGADTYVQRLDGGGATRWGNNGAVLSDAAGNQTYPDIVDNGSGGAILTWIDHRNGNSDIYAQNVGASGQQ